MPLSLCVCVCGVCVCVCVCVYVCVCVCVWYLYFDFKKIPCGWARKTKNQVGLVLLLTKWTNMNVLKKKSIMRKNNTFIIKRLKLFLVEMNLMQKLLDVATKF